MNQSHLRPSVVLAWGVALTIAGALLVLFLPNISYSLSLTSNEATGVNQGFLNAMEIVVRIFGQVVPPLGVVLIGASVVMTYVKQVLTGQPTATDRSEG